jgi:nucleotide-binding universal stress UspA family protein
VIGVLVTFPIRWISRWFLGYFHCLNPRYLNNDYPPAKAIDCRKLSPDPRLPTIVLSCSNRRLFDACRRHSPTVGRSVMLDHILVPLDGSLLAECVLSHAVTLAQAFEARLTLLRVVERNRATGLKRFIDPLQWQIRQVEAGAYLDSLVTRLNRVGLQAEKAILEGLPSERIVEFTQDHKIGMIIISTHGHSGLSGWNVSSVVQKVILHAHVPMMIVRAHANPTTGIVQMRYQRVLVPLDGSQRAECALPLAKRLAIFHNSQLLLVHVVVKPEMPRHMPSSKEEKQLVDRLTGLNQTRAGEYLERLRAQLSLDVKTRVIVSNAPAASLQDVVVQEDADLVVLSAHGYTSGTRWPYGSITLNFIAYGATPLLIVQDLSPEELERAQAELTIGQPKGH